MRAAPAARILPTGAPQQKQLFCGEEGGCGGEVWGWFGVVGEKWRVAVVGTGDGVWLCKRPRPVGWTCQRPGVIFLTIPYQKATPRPRVSLQPMCTIILSLFPVRRCKAMPGKKPQETKRQL